ncbi:Protein lifeguard 1 [Trichoplax sp. H2]|nr:Protein lifeguard 1 [Trichoplax sp. H2]|eukprot:RDD41224.1 Protein lifeguard 1 [Trichoplax sp. H2]
MDGDQLGGQYGYSERAYLTPDDDYNREKSQNAYEYSEAFADQSIRLGLQKTQASKHIVVVTFRLYFRDNYCLQVYCLLFIQLLITCGITALFIFVKPIQEFIHQNMWMYILGIVLLLIVTVIMGSVVEARQVNVILREIPYNYICLLIYTLIMSFMVGTIASYFKVSAVMIAFGIVSIVAFVITIFSLQTKMDFTSQGGLLLGLLGVLMGFGFFCIFFYNRILYIVYASIGAFIFTLYLIYNTQLMMWGQKRYAISPEEYIFATLNLYSDIVNLFIMILEIIGLAEAR